MLWLAGLLGIVSVGATSLVMHQPDVEAEPEEDDDKFPVDAPGSLAEGDMFEFFPGGSDTEGSFDATGSDQLSEAFFSTQDDSDYDVFDAAEKDEWPTSDTPAAQVLQEIVEDPEAAGPLDVDAEANATPVKLWDWLVQGEPSEVLDYDARSDSLMLVWDDLADGAEEPAVRVEKDPFDADVMHVLMNDKSVAEIYGDPDLTSADITMIPLSSALIVGLEAT
jgi:hypothetical protein